MLKTKRTLGQYLYWYRWNYACKSQAEFAKQIGIARETYVRIENDKKTGLSALTLAKIAQATNRRVDYIARLYHTTRRKKGVENEEEVSD